MINNKRLIFKNTHFMGRIIGRYGGRNRNVKRGTRNVFDCLNNICNVQRTLMSFVNMIILLTVAVIGGITGASFFKPAPR